MRALGINTGPATHLDHLGVLCILLDLPLLIPDENTYQTARRFYPELKLYATSWQDLSLDALTQQTDVLLGCGKFWATSLLPAFEDFCGKKMRLVFCPHGNSDKGRSLQDGQSHPIQDIALYYGDHMLDLLNTTGASSAIRHLVRTGNYRYHYYLDRRAFYDDLAEENLFRFLPKDKKTLLFAPTWPNKENPTPIFTYTANLIDELSPTHSLLIKWHPLLEEFYPGPAFHLLGRYADHPHVHFVHDFPAIYPLLQRSDAYIGDFSSIGYDYLLFNRPLYFLPHHSPNPGPLFSCGLTLPETGISAFLDSTWEDNQYRFSSARASLYTHAFGEEKSPQTVKSDLMALL